MSISFLLKQNGFKLLQQNEGGILLQSSSVMSTWFIPDFINGKTSSGSGDREYIRVEERHKGYWTRR